MKAIAMPPFRSIAFAVMLLALAACQPDAAAPATATAAAADESAATVDDDAVAQVQEPEQDLGEFRIVSVLLGNAVDAENVVLTDSRVFTGKDSIYASVLSTGAHQGLRMTAKWLAPDGATIADTAQPLVPVAATAITFKVSNPDGWPPGEYQLLIGVNERTLESKTFQVR